MVLLFNKQERSSSFLVSLLPAVISGRVKKIRAITQRTLVSQGRYL